MSSPLPRPSPSKHSEPSQFDDFTRPPKPSTRLHDKPKPPSDTTECPQSFEGSNSFWPLLLAILPPTCSFFFGMENFWSDSFLLLLVFYYMYSLIQYPWDLYTASRRRRITNPIDSVTSNNEEPDSAAVEALRYEAQVQLRRQEMFTFLLVLISPLLGGWIFALARERLKTLNAFISDFNILLFVLAAEIRPLTHLANIVSGRARELQDRIHHPTAAIESVGRRVAVLENEFKQLKKAYATKHDLGLVRDTLEPNFQKLSKFLLLQQKRDRGEMDRLESLIQSLTQDLSTLKPPRTPDTPASSATASCCDESRLGPVGPVQLSYLDRRWLPVPSLALLKLVYHLPALVLQLSLLPVTLPLYYLGSLAETYLPTNPLPQYLVEQSYPSEHTIEHHCQS